LYPFPDVSYHVVPEPGYDAGSDVFKFNTNPLVTGNIRADDTDAISKDILPLLVLFIKVKAPLLFLFINSIGIRKVLEY
jgi:hypothetical protein